jgi:hypothetical protein
MPWRCMAGEEVGGPGPEVLLQLCCTSRRTGRKLHMCVLGAGGQVDGSEM